MDDNLKQFKDKIVQSEDVSLVDELIENVGKMHDDMEYSINVKLIKKELLKRLK